MTIEQLQLSPIAKEAARILQQHHPDVVFTSGRRNLLEQAQAMAKNIVIGQRRDWIRKTYLHGYPLQSWIDEHPEAVTVVDVTDGLYGVMLNMDTPFLARLSKHFTGDAFDVQPILDRDGLPTADGFRVIEAIKHLPGLEKFLQKEGGLTRWHAQFVASAEV